MRKHPALWLAILIAAAVLPAALADDDDDDDRNDRSRRVVNPKWLDFDSLSGEVRRDDDGPWLLRIKWQVEIDHLDRFPAAREAAAGGLDLVVDVFEDEQRLFGPDDRPIQIVVPLGEPSDVDDGEIEFEGHVTVELPHGAFFDPDDLELVGRLFPRAGDQPLAIEEDNVSYDDPYGGGFSIGIGCFSVSW